MSNSKLNTLFSRLEHLPLTATALGWIYTAVCAVTGLLLMIWPEQSILAVYDTAAVLMVVLGLWRVFKYFRSEPQEAREHQILAQGLILDIFGIILLVYSGRIGDWLPVLLGTAALFLFAIRLQCAMDLRRVKEEKWLVPLVVAIVLAIGGLVMLIFSFDTNAKLIMTGALLALEAVADAFCRLVEMRRQKQEKKQEKEQEKEHE